MSQMILEEDSPTAKAPVLRCGIDQEVGTPGAMRQGQLQPF